MTLRGEVQDPRFLQFLEKVGAERPASFTTKHLLVLDAVHSDLPIGEELRLYLNALIDEGLVERFRQNRGCGHILSRDLYGFLGKRGVYTSLKRLDRETNKALLLKHIAENQTEGSPLQDLMQVLPSLTRNSVQGLLRELKAEGRIRTSGRTKGGRWLLEAGAGIASEDETTTQYQPDP